MRGNVHPCPRCGHERRVAAGDVEKPCGACRNYDRQANRRAVEELWRAGVSGPEIAERLGLKLGSVHSLMSKFRRDGLRGPLPNPAAVALAAKRRPRPTRTCSVCGIEMIKAAWVCGFCELEKKMENAA